MLMPLVGALCYVPVLVGNSCMLRHVDDTQVIGFLCRNPETVPEGYPSRIHLDRQNGQNYGPYTADSLDFEILGHYFGLFWRFRQLVFRVILIAFQA